MMTFGIVGLAMLALFFGAMVSQNTSAERR